MEISLKGIDSYETFAIDSHTVGIRPKWISVDERLPNKYSRVLVTDGKEICLHYKQSCVSFSDERGHDLYCSCPLNHDRCDFAEGQITHWMPLPELPKKCTA